NVELFARERGAEVQVDFAPIRAGSGHTGDGDGAGPRLVVSSDDGEGLGVEEIRDGLDAHRGSAAAADRGENVEHVEIRGEIDVDVGEDGGAEALVEAVDYFCGVGVLEDVVDLAAPEPGHGVEEVAVGGVADGEGEDGDALAVLLDRVNEGEDFV